VSSISPVSYTVEWIEIDLTEKQLPIKYNQTLDVVISYGQQQTNTKFNKFNRSNSTDFSDIIFFLLSVGRLHKCVAIKERISNIIQNITNILKINGFFIGACIDSSTVW
jgi:hypothetical protein